MYSSCKCLIQRQRLTLRTISHSFKSVNSEKSSGENNDIDEKVIYNSAIKHGRFLKSKKNYTVDETYSRPPVLALKFFNSEFEAKLKPSSGVPQTTNNNETEKVNLPYERHHHITFSNSSDESTTLVHDRLTPEDNSVELQDITLDRLLDKPCGRPKRKWMKDYDQYTEVSVKMACDEDEDNFPNITLNYGTADPNVSCSNVPCGGCGAHLHCQDSAIPGYLPREIFVGLRTEQLQAVVCQRCHFLREYKTALSVSVDPEIYPQLLSKIKSQNALVIMVVDMTDFPCSIWPRILDIIGPKRPLVVVGNKIDLLKDFSKDWLEKAKTALVKQLPPKANLLHVTLVSAKTGYGIEDLVTALFNLWEYRGDVYLVGCTNVGKSTLFNALLQSDYCKTKAVDLIQRATTAPWPGTTLNLLKFPILRPEGFRIAMRMNRLKTQHEKDLRLIQEGHVETTPQMISYINRTFSHGSTDKVTDDYWDDPFSLPKLDTLRRLKSPGSGLDPSDPVFARSKWVYDTPGVVTPDQIIDLLTTEELMLTLPREPIIPRTLQIWPGQSLLLAGLGRLDYISGPANIKMTVLGAATLPVTLCWIKDAEIVYQHYLGSEAMAVPCGGAERLQLWPGLHSGPQFVLKGDGWKQSCADVVLSSAGWIAVTAVQDSMCQLQAWTPRARGIHVRIPPVLPRAIALKGTKMYRSQAYALFNKYIKK